MGVLTKIKKWGGGIFLCCNFYFFCDIVNNLKFKVMSSSVSSKVKTQIMGLKSGNPSSDKSAKKANKFCKGGKLSKKC